jgi:E1A-binding protein p400
LSFFYRTKETLANGHFMSVINILMQLRKVCNHPNLFDPRPIISPFQMDGITCTTASIVLKALGKDSYIASLLQPSLVELEFRLPGFEAHCVNRLVCPKSLITEIDSAPEPPVRPVPLAKPLKFVYQCPVPVGNAGRASPFDPMPRSDSPLTVQTSLAASPAPVPSANSGLKAVAGSSGLLIVSSEANSGWSISSIFFSISSHLKCEVIYQACLSF